MRCPYCGCSYTEVVDSRPVEDTSSIRRRRRCKSDACRLRFTTYEHVHLRDLKVVKKGGEKEPFDLSKVLRSMEIALRRRPVPPKRLDQAGKAIYQALETSPDNQIPSQVIGEMVMDQLAQLDRVAYVRFASVYKDFRDTKDFENFLGSLKS